MSRKIGFIGLGIMGRPMALNLIRVGYTLYVYSSNPETLAQLQAAGATAMHDAKAVAGASEIIITMLPDSPDVKRVALGPAGLIEGLHAGKVYIDMSTIDIGVIKEISEAFKNLGVETIDTPVSGGQPGAESGSLSVMAGGDIETFRRVLPVLEAMGKKINYMGPVGSGQLTKSCNQIATALATRGVIEAFSLAREAGVDLTLLRAAMLGGFAQSKALEIAGQKMIDNNFEPGFKVRLYRKDLRIAQEKAALLQVDISGTELVAGDMDRLIEDGKGELDFSVLYRLSQ